MRSKLHVFPDLTLISHVVLGRTGVVIADPPPEFCGVVRGVPPKCAGQNPGTDVDVQAAIINDLVSCDPHAGEFWQVHRVHLGRPHVITSVQVPADMSDPTTLSE